MFTKSYIIFFQNKTLFPSASFSLIGLSKIHLQHHLLRCQHKIITNRYQNTSTTR